MTDRFAWIVMPASCGCFFGFATTATAQAGLACSGPVCGLGGQIRGQLGFDLPIPISIAPAQGNGANYPLPPSSVGSPFLLRTIMSVPFPGAGLPLVGNGLGAPGQIKPIPSAAIMQTTLSIPRALSLAPAVFRYADQPAVSLGIVNFDFRRFMLQTNLEFDIPHPGTTPSGAQAMTFSGAAIPTSMANVFSAGGRIGAATVTYYANATTLGPGSPTDNFSATLMAPPAAGEAGSLDINGVARFTATGNQFGGQMIGRVTGTARVFFNRIPLNIVTDLPCKVTATPAEGTTAQGTFVPFHTGTDCQFNLSVMDPKASGASVTIRGGAFGGRSSVPVATTRPGAFTGTIGFNGTILGQGAPVTALGVNVPFTRDGRRVVGFPLTTGRLSITVTNLTHSTSMFIRTGIDARDANGNGIVALVTGSMTARDIGVGSHNRTWVTLEIPEPSAVAGAGIGLLALVGCHQLSRRLRR